MRINHESIQLTREDRLRIGLCSGEVFRLDEAERLRELAREACEAELEREVACFNALEGGALQTIDHVRGKGSETFAQFETGKLSRMLRVLGGLCGVQQGGESVFMPPGWIDKASFAPGSKPLRRGNCVSREAVPRRRGTH